MVCGDFKDLLRRTASDKILSYILCRAKNQMKNYTNQLLEDFKNEKYIHLLNKIFEVLILWIRN